MHMAIADDEHSNASLRKDKYGTAHQGNTMKFVIPLIVALAARAITAIVSGLFIQSGPLRALVTGTGAFLAILVYRLVSPKTGK